MKVIEFFFDYGLFLAKAITIIGGIIALVIVIVALIDRNKDEQKSGHIEIKKLNDKYEQTEHALKSAMLSEKQQKQLEKALKAKHKAEKKQDATQEKPRVFVLDFDGDIRAAAVSSLREEISAILLVADKNDEVLVKLHSAGGLVHAYGLAASQLARLTDKQIPLTISVDKVAASGGYMMACVADKVIAAPFAILGSIGVVAQIPNFNRLLKKHDIDYELLTAGEYKRTLTVFGENTDKARNKFKEDMEDTHQLFKDFITKHRPIVDIDKVATGEHWFATRAQELKLVDELSTSDDYLLARSKEADLYEITYTSKKKFGAKFADFFNHASDRVLNHVFNRSQEQRLS